VLTLILAGGAGSRLEALTERRAKPALPFGGTYRLIDIPLSNLLHSGLSDVWIVEQYRPHSLNDHLANGRPWDLDRTHGGLRVLPPYQGDEGEGFAEGNADALYRQRSLIREFSPDLVLVLSADHLYTLDYSELVAAHLESEAALTMVTTHVPQEDAARFAVVEVQGGRVTGFEYKPDEPKTDLVGAEVFLYDARVLLETLEHLAKKGEGLEDYGDALLPHLVEQGSVFEYRLEGYWRDVGTLDAYWQAHMELVEGTGLALDDPAWPILTGSPQRLPARVQEGARIRDGLLSPGATVAGEVVRSVLSPGVVVEAGAKVVDSVLLEAVRVEAGANVARVVADIGARVGRGARVGGEGDLALLGMGATVPPEGRVEAGGRVDPDEG